MQLMRLTTQWLCTGAWHAEHVTVGPVITSAHAWHVRIIHVPDPAAHADEGVQVVVEEDAGKEAEGPLGLITLVGHSVCWSTNGCAEYILLLIFAQFRPNFRLDDFLQGQHGHLSR